MKPMIQTFAIAVLLSFALFTLAPQRASAESPSAAVADGKPWSVTTDDGHKMKITFYPDGTAKLKLGIMSKTASWTPTETGLCLDGPRGNRCLTLIRTENGFIGKDGDAVAMTLQR